MKAVVFAAGRGERLWPLTETKPKPLLPLGGKPILERTLSGLVTGGIHEIIIVVSYKEEMIRGFVGNGRGLGCTVSYVHQRTPAGTADALRACQGQLRKEHEFIVVYGDDYYQASGLSRFVRYAARIKGNLIAAGDAEDSSRFGILETKNGLVKSIHEKSGSRAPAKVNAGIYMFKETVFKIIRRLQRSPRGEYELTDSVNQLVGQGEKVRMFSLRRGEWLGVTYPWDLLQANAMALEEDRTVASGLVERGVKITGKLSLSKGSVVRFGSSVEGPVVVGEGSILGPNSYVRAFTSIGKNCRIGANCEVKNSIIMDNVHIPHLSYVGDSVVGDGTSLGAGTITANLRFDQANVHSWVKDRLVDSGRRKLGTIFGEDVRTGINVSVLPGVKIGPRAWIGPGVIVKTDVRSGKKVKK
jgi:UDP-N-acetylglucosamine diphosphorylase/glucosamine-1-phosphate N-acetyltransferase